MNSTHNINTTERPDFTTRSTHGYQFVHIPGVSNIIKAFQEADFDAKIPPASYIEGRQPASNFQIEVKDESGTHEQSFYRDSWFLSENYHGPFGSRVTIFLGMIQPIIHRFFQERPELQYNQDKLRKSMGVHRYLPEMSKPGDVGLPEHFDVDILTILATDQPLEGFIEGEWKTINIPQDHVMVFSGLTTTAATGERPLLHRVDKKDKAKFSIGAFIGADAGAKFKIGANTDPAFAPFKDKTVDEFQQNYFTKGFNLSE